eukprot:504150-Amphidinium_carterae.2
MLVTLFVVQVNSKLRVWYNAGANMQYERSAQEGDFSANTRTFNDKPLRNCRLKPAYEPSELQATVETGCRSLGKTFGQDLGQNSGPHGSFTDRLTPPVRKLRNGRHHSVLIFHCIICGAQCRQYHMNCIPFDPC